jgi:hypothetical protein
LGTLILVQTPFKKARERQQAMSPSSAESAAGTLFKNGFQCLLFNMMHGREWHTRD